MIGIEIKNLEVDMKKESSKNAIKSMTGIDENRIKILFVCHGTK